MLCRASEFSARCETKKPDDFLIGFGVQKTKSEQLDENVTEIVPCFMQTMKRSREQAEQGVEYNVGR